MSKTTILLMIDGLDPEYLDACPTPNFIDLAHLGFRTEANAMMPTVTNVNNASLLTATYPSAHGITSNYWLDRERRTETYMESGQFLEADTFFERAALLGARSLLVTAKDKLRKLLGHETFVNVSAECPPDWLMDEIGPPPPIYSLEVNGWIVDAARCILSEMAFDLAYVGTTDYPMHTYAPHEPESAIHLGLLDVAVGRLVDSVDCEILITADHGTSAKERMLSLPEFLMRYGILARAVPIIKDRYTVHHSNLGGCIYLYLHDRDRHTLAAAVDLLRQVDGVDEVLSKPESTDGRREGQASWDEGAYQGESLGSMGTDVTRQRVFSSRTGLRERSGNAGNRVIVTLDAAGYARGAGGREFGGVGSVADSAVRTGAAGRAIGPGRG